MPRLPLLLLLLSCVAALWSSAAALTVGWPKDWPEPLRDIKDAEMMKMLRRRQNHHHAMPSDAAAAGTGSDSQLVIRDRAGTHVFWIHNGRAVDAQLGVGRVYDVREGVFYNEICTCAARRHFRGGRRDGGPRRACARRYKPAFYGLVAGGCLLALLALAGLVCGAVACYRRSRRARAFGHRLLVEDDTVEKEKCRVEACDPRGGFQNIQKVAL